MRGGVLEPATGDLFIRGGEWVIGETTEQNQFIILKSNKGEIKSDPLCGVGLDNMLLEHNFTAIRKEIINQMERDGQRIEKCVAGESGVYLDAGYRNSNF
jgi:hypothetical protein